ncbi:MAG: hypothetical protein K5682_03930 [Lachnospiraceae bacterium]|nr:hypothetical protein [Lachnospiraceae bacterium]
MKKRDSVIFGIALILIAVAILGEGLNLFGSLPLLKVILSLLMGLGALYDLFFHRRFFRPLVLMGIIVCLFRAELKLLSLSYFVIILIAVLLGLGLEMIFRGGKGHVLSKGFQTFSDSICNGYGKFEGEGNYSCTDGNINIDSGFNPFTAYLTRESIRTLNIDSGMGAVTVYIGDGCTLMSGATANISSGMAPVDVYFPSAWRIQIQSQDGNVNYDWDPLNERLPEDAPTISLNVGSGMAPVNIHRQ